MREADPRRIAARLLDEHGLHVAVAGQGRTHEEFRDVRIPRGERQRPGRACSLRGDVEPVGQRADVARQQREDQLVDLPQARLGLGVHHVVRRAIGGTREQAGLRDDERRFEGLERVPPDALAARDHELAARQQRVLEALQRLALLEFALENRRKLQALAHHRRAIRGRRTDGRIGRGRRERADRPGQARREEAGQKVRLQHGDTPRRCHRIAGHTYCISRVARVTATWIDVAVLIFAPVSASRIR